MNEIRLSGLLRERYKSKLFGFVNKYCASVLGYSRTPCSYTNNLSSHPLRNCSMHSPLRTKIQNALNKALQLEARDVLFVGGRRQNRKRKRKHGKEKRKGKKYEGKETPILNAKQYNAKDGKYITLLTEEDDISLSPSMIEDLMDDSTSFDVISINHVENTQDFENICNNDLSRNEEIEEMLDNGMRNEKSWQEELDNFQDITSSVAEERPKSCDTGYHSEEEQKGNFTSDDEDLQEKDDVFDAEKHNLSKKIYFVPNLVDTTEEGIYLTKPEVLFPQKIVAIPKQTDGDDDKQQLQIVGKDNDTKANAVLHSDKFNVEEMLSKQPRLTINFDYENEEEEEVYTKQPRKWLRRKIEDEETRPLICCGEENGVGLACCTIL